MKNLELIPRYLRNSIENWLFKGKVIIIYGPRQVGKTTLAKQILDQYNGVFVNCEILAVKEILESQNPDKIKAYFGNTTLVVLDEAQKIKNIGTTLKILVDTFPEMQIIATGSSSFDLANEVVEPLTGRNIKFTLFPFSLFELHFRHDKFSLHGKLGDFLVYGTYPDVIDRSYSEMKTLINEISTDYLYQDVLEFKSLKKSDLLHKLLKALALQLGNEVSYHELATLLQTSSETIQHYIDLLEKSFVIFRLTSFSRNLRNELGKKTKIYFYDLGVRNSILQNYTPMDNRNDIGALWENFCIIERIKRNQRLDRLVNMYFWRTYSQKEIDYIEEADGELLAVEFKWSGRKKAKKPIEFFEAYENSDFLVVSPDNYQDFLT